MGTQNCDCYYVYSEDFNIEFGKVEVIDENTVKITADVTIPTTLVFKTTFKTGEKLYIGTAIDFYCKITAEVDLGKPLINMRIDNYIPYITDRFVLKHVKPDGSYWTSSYQDIYDRGYRDGYSSGYNAGYCDGYDSGYTDGTLYTKD